ncbi:right-handed parallel beta-helix repeat-containing protein [Actinopolyspora sp. H202]|uniref:right-handed parallel beta-helix repeat-containing protein n=1 Tax=Actinopolyspora sp. H202 TaxID=1500456 RepID=UPI003EE723E8
MRIGISQAGARGRTPKILGMALLATLTFAAPAYADRDATTANETTGDVSTSAGTTDTASVQAACGSGSYDAEVYSNNGSWIARNGSTTVYSGGNMRAATQAAVNSLTAGRQRKERVVLWNSGTMSASSSIDLPSYTVLDSCGTIDVTGGVSANNAVVRGRDADHVEVQHLSVTGAPYFGVFFRNGNDIHLGQIDLRLSGGLGIRIDNHGDRGELTTNVRIDDVYVSGTDNHGVETYGVDGLTVGTVVARDVAYSGLLLNDTTNATVGTVDAENAGSGTGYAAFRMANRNGRINGSYPTNIHVGEVIARGGGRGVFCVSESGGAVIDNVDIANTGNNAILIENCYNVDIAAESGRVTGPGTIRLAARSEFPVTRNVTLHNLTVTDSAIVENPCGDNITITNNTLQNSYRDVC